MQKYSITFASKLTFMKHVLSSLALVAVMASCASAPDADKASASDAQESKATSGNEMAVNTSDSKVEWTGTKVTGQHMGNFPITEGKLMAEDGKLSGGMFTLSVQDLEVTDLEGEYKGKLEGHLKSADFFAADSLPNAMFEITNVAYTMPEGLEVKLEGANAYITGNLTLRGVTKSISFPAMVKMENNMAMAKADFNINRMDFGVSYAGMKDDLIRKDVNIKVNLMAGDASTASVEHSHDDHAGHNH